MRLTSALLLPAAFAPAALAVFADDAYHIDYHNALLGFPRPHATFFQQPVPGSKASLIYTLSERNVLAAVNPKDGTIVWRQLLSSSSNSTSGFLRAGDDQDVIISGVDGQIAAWRASDGRLAWSTIAGASSVKDLEILELEDGLSTAGAKDAIVLSEPGLPTVSRIDGKDGHVKWQYEDNRYDTFATGSPERQADAETAEIHPFKYWLRAPTSITLPFTVRCSETTKSKSNRSIP